MKGVSFPAATPSLLSKRKPKLKKRTKSHLRPSIKLGSHHNDSHKNITSDFLYRISPKLVKKYGKCELKFNYAFKYVRHRGDFHEPRIFSTSLCEPRRIYKNPRNASAADTTSHPQGHDLDVRRLMCTTDIWGSHSRTDATSPLYMTPCRLSYTLLAVGAGVRKASTEDTPTNI
jgi:hypothetical protein